MSDSDHGIILEIRNISGSLTVWPGMSSDRTVNNRRRTTVLLGITPRVGHRSTADSFCAGSRVTKMAEPACSPAREGVPSRVFSGISVSPDGKGSARYQQMTTLAPASQSGSSLPGAALPTTASTLGVHLPGKMGKGGKGETAQVRRTLGEKHPVLQVTSTPASLSGSLHRLTERPD